MIYLLAVFYSPDYLLCDFRLENSIRVTCVASVSCSTSEPHTSTAGLGAYPLPAIVTQSDNILPAGNHCISPVLHCSFDLFIALPEF